MKEGKATELVYPFEGFCPALKRRSRVAVITRTRNRPTLLQRALHSVLEQDFSDWIHVIINDNGDGDSVAEVLRPLLPAYKGRLILLDNKLQRGIQFASNAAIAFSRSDFIAIHDDDDLWEPGFLESCIRHMDEASRDSLCQGVATHVDQIFESLEEDGTIRPIRREPFTRIKRVNLFGVAQSNPFPPIGFLFSRPAYQEIGGFDDTYSLIGDWEFNLRFLKKFDIAILPRVLALYHWRTNETAAGASSNSMTEQRDSHRDELNRMQNAQLRRHLEKHPEQWGLILNLAGHSIADRARTQAAIQNLQRSVVSLQDSVEGGRQKEITSPEIEKDERRSYFKSSGKSIEDWRKRADSLLSSAKFLSLEIFGTILLRRIASPKERFDWMAQKMACRGVEIEQFAQSRSTSEEQARKSLETSSAEAERPILAEETYKILGETLQLDITGTNSLMQLELDGERVLSVVNPVILKLIQSAKGKGLKVYALSDPFWDTSIVRRLLEENSVEVDGFVQMDDLEEGGLHIGSRLKEDRIEAEKKGLLSHRWNQSLYLRTGVTHHLSPEKQTSIASEFHRNACIINRLQECSTPPENAYWMAIGFEVAGPACLGFVSWLVKKAKEANLRQLNFLSPEGLLFKQCFDYLSRSQNMEIECRTVQSSPRILQIAALACCDVETWSSLLRPVHGEQICDILDRFGLEVGHLKDSPLWDRKLKAFLQKTLDQPSRKNQFIQLLHSFREEILYQSEVESTHFLGYLKENGLMRDRIGWVDSGLFGNQIQNLRTLLDSANTEKFAFHGFTFSNLEHFYSPDPRKSQAIPYWSTGGPESGDLISEGAALLRFIFGSGQAQIHKIRKVDEKWKATSLLPDYQANLKGLHAAIRQGVEKYLGSFLECGVPFSSGLPFEDGPRQGLEQLVHFPTEEDLRQWVQLPYHDAYSPNPASPNVRQMIPNLHWYTSKSKVIRSFRDCPWRAGFIARHYKYSRRLKHQP